LIRVKSTYILFLISGKHLWWSWQNLQSSRRLCWWLGWRSEMAAE